MFFTKSKAKMTKPYALISDLHFHKWQVFSQVLPDGMNSRLAGLTSEVKRAALSLLEHDGDTMYVAGDVFHVRGSIAPSVLNPVIAVFKEVIAMGIKVRLIAGNHDLEGKDSVALSSAVTSLEGIGVDVCHNANYYSENNVIKVFMFPWQDKLDDLRAAVQKVLPEHRKEADLIIHAPLNGVITGLPEHGLSTEEIAKWGFKRVFAGHHHNHKDMGQGVYSIGALAHHTWSDVGSKAGFLLVSDSNVRWMKSHLPEFIDIQAEMTEIDAELAAEGNFVRAKVIDNKTSTIESMREWLLKAGAKGVIIQSMKQATTVRSGVVTVSIGAGASLEKSVSDYIASQFDKSLIDKINLGCQQILARTNV